MSEISDLSSILQNSLLLYSYNNNENQSSDAFQEIQNRLGAMPSVLDEDFLTRLRNGEYEISFNGKPIHTSKDVTDVGKWLMSLRIISSL